MDEWWTGVDASRFDQMVKALAAADTRRGVLRRLTALQLIGVLAVRIVEDGAAKRRGSLAVLSLLSNA